MLWKYTVFIFTPYPAHTSNRLFTSNVYMTVQIISKLSQMLSHCSKRPLSGLKEGLNYQFEALNSQVSGILLRRTTDLASWQTVTVWHFAWVMREGDSPICTVWHTFVYECAFFIASRTSQLRLISGAVTMFCEAIKFRREEGIGLFERASEGLVDVLHIIWSLKVISDLKLLLRALLLICQDRKIFVEVSQKLSLHTFLDRG